MKKKKRQNENFLWLFWFCFRRVQIPGARFLELENFVSDCGWENFERKNFCVCSVIFERAKGNFGRKRFCSSLLHFFFTAAFLLEFWEEFPIVV